MNDEALARLLQAQENAAVALQQRAAAQHRLRGSSSASLQFTAQVEGGLSKVLGYEDELAQAMALSIMPLPELEAAAEEAVGVSAAMGEQPLLSREDALAQELLLWFKRDFFTWVNSPPCEHCGAVTRGAGVGGPTADEAAAGAGRTELFHCGQCGGTTRFPRYNDPVKLLETRRGRCGEWANCFTLCCRAVGLDARLAVDIGGDHVWTEVWSAAAARWVHLDPCEAAWDQPLLYEAGWGKRLGYVLAIGRDGVVDVTRRYTQRFEEARQRRYQVSEEWLAGYLRATTARLRAALPAEERHELEQRDELDAQSQLGAGGQAPSGDQLSLPARQTGDAAWLAARGEGGGAAAAHHGSDAAVAGVPLPGTRYRLAKDQHLQAAHPTRLCGGAARASGENAPSETAAAAFDGSTRTKWLDFGGSRPNAWLEYRLPAERAPVALAAYALTSANDSPERDPRHVVLEAWDEDREAWAVLDEQRALSFSRRHQRLQLPLAGPAPPSRRFRLRVVSVADPAAANSVQLSCLELYTRQREPPEQREQQPEHGLGQASEAQASERSQPVEGQQPGQMVQVAVQGQPLEAEAGKARGDANEAEQAAHRLAALTVEQQQQQDSCGGQEQLHPQAESNPQQQAPQPPPPQHDAEPALLTVPPPGPASSGGEAEGQRENPWAALFATRQ